MRCDNCLKVFYVEDENDFACLEETGLCLNCYTAYLNDKKPKHPDNR